MLEEWPGPEIKAFEFGGQTMVGSTRLFGDATRPGVGPGGWVARGDGDAYCVTVFRVDAAEPPAASAGPGSARR